MNENTTSLAKVPKYSFLDKFDQHTAIDMTINFYILANQIRWRESCAMTNEQTNAITYPESKYISKPDSTPELETTLYGNSTINCNISWQ